MSRPQPPRQVPTLTEVVRVVGPAEPEPRASDPASPVEAPLPAPAPLAPASLPVPAAGAATESEAAAAGEPAVPPVPPPAFLLAGSEEQIAHRVLTDLQRQIDMMLEYRLREALTPALARMSEQLIRETRIELADTLRDVIARAVAQELARMRGK